MLKKGDLLNIGYYDYGQYFTGSDYFEYSNEGLDQIIEFLNNMAEGLKSDKEGKWEK